MLPPTTILRIFFFLTTLFLITVPSTAQTATPDAISRNSNIYISLVFPAIFDSILIENIETPIQFRAFVYFNLVTFNAWSSYHPTAVDIFGRSRFRRPQSEHTSQNKNTAIIYGLLRLYESSPQSFGGPSRLPNFYQLMNSLGLDPNDRSMNMSTPIGIGNRQGLDLAKLLDMDGWNANGLSTATNPTYALPFQDQTGYVAQNPPSMLKFPFKWQPVLETDRKGFFFRQEHVVPQAGFGIAFSQTPSDITGRVAPNLYKNRDAPAGGEEKEDIEKLRNLARGVLKTSAQLTELQRLYAELFDSKVSAFRTKANPSGTPSIASTIRIFILGPQLSMDLDKDVMYGLASNFATFDAVVAVWKEKIRQDAVRPTGQTMQYLFGEDERFEVWGGPGKANAKITAAEWKPYIRTMPHSEYPSASSCACSSFVEHALTFTGGKDDFPFNVTFVKGSSKFHPGQVPENDVSVTINKLSEWARLCGKSRLYAGVHFEPAVEAGEKLCEGIGKKSQEIVDRLVSGKGDFTWLTWLPKDVERFWEK